jgi:hypothetical protein
MQSQQYLQGIDPAASARLVPRAALPCLDCRAVEMLQGIWRGTPGSRHDCTCEAVPKTHVALLAYLWRITHSTRTSHPASLCCHHLRIQLQCRRQNSHASPPPGAGLHHHREGWATCIAGRALVSAAPLLLCNPSSSRSIAVRLQHMSSHHVKPKHQTWQCAHETQRLDQPVMASRSSIPGQSARGAAAPDPAHPAWTMQQYSQRTATHVASIVKVSTGCRSLRYSGKRQDVHSTQRQCMLK